MNQEIQQLRNKPQRIISLGAGLTGLVVSYLFQSVDLLTLFCDCNFHPHLHFVVKKIVRVIINDTCMLLIIYYWFMDSKITLLAWRVQLVDTLILLPLYLTAKLMIEDDREISSPLLSQLHRMIVNPTLMILIIPGVYFQRMKTKNGHA